MYTSGFIWHDHKNHRNISFLQSLDRENVRLTSNSMAMQLVSSCCFFLLLAGNVWHASWCTACNWPMCFAFGIWVRLQTSSKLLKDIWQYIINTVTCVALHALTLRHVQNIICWVILEADVRLPLSPCWNGEKKVCKNSFSSHVRNCFAATKI